MGMAVVETVRGRALPEGRVRKPVRQTHARARTHTHAHTHARTYTRTHTHTYIHRARERARARQVGRERETLRARAPVFLTCISDVGSRILHATPG